MNNNMNNMNNNDIYKYLNEWIPNKCITAIQCGQKRYDVENKMNNNEIETNNDIYSCSVCQITSFVSIESYKEHYKSEFHNYNLKRDVLDMRVVTYEEYMKLNNEEKNAITIEELELNNFSNNNKKNNSDDDDDDVRLIGSPRINIFTNDKWNNYVNLNLTFWKAVLLHPSEVAYSINDELEPLYRELSCISDTLNNTSWAIFLSQGGRFAGGIFHPNKGCIEHKTIQRYTVRRKQGGSQVAKDSQNATSQPKSVGSSLRRHNWVRLGEDIQQLLVTWKDLLSQCSRIFIHAPSYNRQLLYGANLFDSKDLRVRAIPCIVHNITFKEVERVYHVLKKVDIQSTTIPLDTNKEIMNNNDKVVRDNNIDEEIKLQRDISEESMSSNKSIDKSIHEQILDAINDQQDIETIRQLCRQYLLDVPHFSGQSGLVLAVKRNNQEILDMLLKFNVEDINVLDKNNGESPLHIAAEQSNVDMIKYILSKGGNPLLRDMKKRTPYDRAPNKTIRNIFRVYAADHPNQWDYDSINLIPSTMEQLEEAANKAKAKKAAKRRRQKKNKKKRQQEQQKQKEEEEEEEEEEKKVNVVVKENTNNQLSNVEQMRRKRLEHLSKSLPSTSIMGKPCDNPECNKPLPKKPFEWTSYKYCSVMCVQFHRLMIQHQT